MKSSHMFRNPLARARGLGSAKEGVGHWWAQRVSAVAIVPLATWLIYSLIAMLYGGSVLHIKAWLADPLKALPLAALLALMFYHARLGMQVVIEDYFHHHGWKITLLLLNSFLCASGALLAIVAILKLHLNP